VDRSRGPFFVDDRVTVRPMFLPYERPVGERERLNLEHLRQGFDWRQRPDVLVISQQSGLPPDAATLFDHRPKSVMYAEFFVPSDIAARKEWPLHESMKNVTEHWRKKSLFDAEYTDAIIVPTHHAKQMWPKKYHDKIHVIFDGVDTQHLARERILSLSGYGSQIRNTYPGKRLIGYIGRTIESIRGFDMWMKAYLELRTKRTDLHFIVLGEDKIIQRGGGSEFYYGIPSFKKWTLESLGLDEKRLSDITWIPRLEFYDFLSLVGELDLAIYPMFGMFGNWSLFQSLHMGTPIVASNRAYLPEVFRHGENGFLTDPEDISKIVECAQMLLDSPRLTETVRRNAAMTIEERYSVRKSSHDFVSLLGKMGVESSVGIGI
jgi:glycosyltransferase involved in cell wall biosynthesis